MIIIKYILYTVSFCVCFCNNVFCADFTYKNLPIGEKVDIPNSEFYIASIGSLGNYNTKYGHVHYLLFSKKNNSYRIIIDENSRTFSIYLPPSHHNYLAISNNYASGESMISIYKTEEKEPYLRKVYQTPENKTERAGWEIKDWTDEYIILKCSINEKNSSIRLSMKTLK